MSTLNPPTPAPPNPGTTARLEALRRRLASTSDGDAALRTLLVLAHETIRQRQIAAEAAARARHLSASRTPVKRSFPGTYHELIEHVHAVVRAHIPVGARLLILGKGDDAILIPGYDTGHFPRGADGGYAGHYPANSAAAIEHLEACQAAGAEYLVIPAPSYWWLEYYGGLTSHLLSHGRIQFHDPRCLIIQLQLRSQGASG